MTAAPTATRPRLFALDDTQCHAAADAVGVPCFGFDLSAARHRFRQLRAVLPERVELAYAVKSNPGAPLLAALAGEGAWFDCASAGEVEAVTATLRSTATAGRLLLAGPGKREADLHSAVQAGARIQVDGPEDLAWLQQHWHGAEPLPVSVRVNPRAGISEANPIIGGAGPSAFGVDEEDLAAFLAHASGLNRVRVAGLQVFAASNELDADTLLANHRIALQIGEEMQLRIGHELDLIDLGGGLGIPYQQGETELDVQRLGSGLARLLEEHAWFTGRLVLEPGRWLSGPIGVYLTSVTRIKRSRGVSFAILAGGINHLLRPLLTGQSFPVRRVGTDGAGGADSADELETFTLAGPLCTSLDRIGVADLPADLAPGDLLAFGQAGAYSLTQAMTHFLSHPAPTQHWLDS